MQNDRESVAATQADREAAAFVHEANYGRNIGYSRTLDGDRDAEFGVQAFARHRHAALSDQQNGWIVLSGDGKRFRTWKDGWSAWTDDRALATRYARRQDAEAVHSEDEDACFIVLYGLDQRNSFALSEALDWAIAELRGATRYDHDEQRENCFALAEEALARTERTL